LPEGKTFFSLYGVPRGGIAAAHHVARSCPLPCEVTYDIEEADFIIDDLIDSGATKSSYMESHTSIPFYALFDKRGVFKDTWLVFPWEVKDESAGPTDAVVRLLQLIGEDTNRGGLLETPNRVVKAWGEWCGGYNVDIGSLFKVFTDGAEQSDEMIVVKDIPFYSHCEHHMAPFFGTATIAYIPNGSIIGLSKLNRVVKAFAQRLQVQERLTTQIANAMEEHLQPLGVAVRLQARHMCMESRGVCQSGHTTVTNTLRGAFRTQPETRAEFLALCNG